MNRLFGLRQRKQYETQVEGLRNQSFNMEQANYATQSLKDTQSTINEMRDGANQMKKEFKKASPSQMEMKVNTTRPSDDNTIRELLESFTKPDNLEQFPLIILMQVLSMVGDIDLLNLAESSTRFENIAKIVLHDRYTRKYFTIDATKFNSSRYMEFLERFGSQIKAINVFGTRLKMVDHWIASLFSMANNYEKLELHVDWLDESINELCLQQSVSSSITHLTLDVEFRETEKVLAIPRFCNLKEFNALNSPCISFESLKEIILDNRGLENLCIKSTRCRDSGYMILASYPFGELMKVLIEATLLNQKLKLFEYAPASAPNPFSFRSQQLDLIIDAFVDSLKHLESLGLSNDVLDLDEYELLYRFGSRCKYIKDLRLHAINGGNNEIFNAIKSFKRIESLLLEIKDLNGDNIVSLVENLPLLRRLRIEIFSEITDLSFVIMALSKSQSLEKITFDFYCLRRNFEIFNSTEFFNNINDSISRQNIKVEVVHRMETIGWISTDQVIWRNKLVNWVGYDPNKSTSNTELLDLANQTATDSTVSPFNAILGYLDLNSLQALSRTNRKCSRLVDDYVEKHSQQQGTFTVTDEFFTPFNTDYKRLDKFFDKIVNLKANIYHCDINALRNMFDQFQNLNKLYINETYYHSKYFIVPQVRHFIYDGWRGQFIGSCCLYEFSEQCPDLEVLELKRKLIAICHPKKTLKFRNLKKLTFKYDGIEQLQTLEYMFKNTNTELIATK